MRILYICGDLGIPVFGRKGASTHIREMVHALRELGHEVIVAAADIGGDRREDEDFPLVKLACPKSRKLGIDGRYLLADFQSRRLLAKAIEEYKPDAIYERLSLYFRAGQWAARRSGLPRIFEVNSLLSEEQNDRLHFPSLARRWEMDLIASAKAIAAISGYMGRHLEELGCEKERIRPFPMAVDPARFFPNDEGINKRKELGWPEGDLIFGYVGSMNSYHKPSWFMDLAEKMLRRGEEGVRFLVVGGGKLKVHRHRNRLFQYVEDGRVHFTGTVPQSDMAGWISAMDIVLVPGASPQSTPTKIFEAAAVGRPLVLPATEPIRELCGHHSPYLFRPNDFRSFEERIREFCNDPKPFREKVDRLQKKVFADHTWEAHARGVVEWFEELKNVR